jgi:hypothetical protein
VDGRRKRDAPGRLQPRPARRIIETPMSPANFISAYQRTVDGIPALFSRWAGLDDELRDHLLCEFVRLLAERASLIGEGVFVGEDGDLLLRLDAKLRVLSGDLQKTIGDGFPSALMPGEPSRSI